MKLSGASALNFVESAACVDGKTVSSVTEIAQIYVPLGELVVIEKEKAINLAQMNEDPKMASKPEQVKAKIIEGKIKKYFSEVCLLEQAFVRSDLFEGTVAGYVASVAKALGADIKVTGYTRLAKGEGIEKKVDDFAAEVASMM
jgi:elongation factor Ts